MKTVLTPMQRYQQDLAAGVLVSDPAQLYAVECLQDVYQSLMANRESRKKHASFFARFFTARAEAVKGLYLWGGVGRGKTYLMDLFYGCLPQERKMRMHFHRFMLMVHKRLGNLKGQPDPLQKLARDLAREIDIICFDEFFVTDIGDAMILAGLLETLFSHGVTLVTTSNIEPHNLYENGLQRANFLPAIALLQRHTRVVNVDSGIDYRLRSLEQAEIYHSPLGAAADRSLQQSFQQLCAGMHTVADSTIEIQNRQIHTRYRAEDLVWFEFEEICGGPRSPADYIEIAQLFHTVIISNMPQLDAYSDDKARRFINLVDEFYDHKVKLIISAAVPLRHLYQGTALRGAFARTESRLLEMQSHDYLALEHTP